MPSVALVVKRARGAFSGKPNIRAPTKEVEKRSSYLAVNIAIDKAYTAASCGLSTTGASA